MNANKREFSTIAVWRLPFSFAFIRVHWRTVFAFDATRSRAGLRQGAC
ncbi:MAG: hypothetical protein ISP90_12320 [Nevskia sp.]|nr:hypothetical protein [Nevskia sp.]